MEFTTSAPVEPDFCAWRRRRDFPLRSRRVMLRQLREEREVTEIVLSTARMMIRRFGPDDLDDLASLYADPEVRRYLPRGALTREQTAEELETYIEGLSPSRPELGLWAVIEASTGRFIGRCGLIPWTIDGADEVEIAYMLGRRDWGRGLGREIARALVRHGFALGLPRLIALIAPGNQASMRTAESAGFAFDRHCTPDGHPALLYSIEAHHPPVH
jgi:ribosomal-protein-alanine N-acetyltransferase